MKSSKFLVLLLSSIAALPAYAADFDGSKALLCATIEARDCVLATECFTGHARKVGAPPFLRIDFKKKTVTGTERTSPISSVDITDAQVLLQGAELDYGWSLAIDQETGDFSAALTNKDGAFLLFGLCTTQD